MSASGVKQGNVFIEIGADPSKFFSAVNRVNARLGQMGRKLSSAGSSVAGFGLAFAAPFAGAVMAGTKFQNVLLNIGASTGKTAAEIESVRAASMSMSQSLGVGPTEAAQGMLELLKAGMGLQDVLGGAGKSAIEFARVGNIDIATAAVVMSDAMNVFGVSASEAANTMSAAADASSTSIEGMTQAFSMSSAVAALANQSIGDLSAALAILANNGVKGSDAGTSIKTMLLRLMAPTEDAIGGMKQLGLSVQSFRGADGKILPMVEIIRVLNGQLKNLDKTAQDDVLRKIFGSDAIRAAAILTSSGVEGFQGMQDAMKGALPVSDKFKKLMSGLMGAGMTLWSAIERLAIAVGDALAPAIAKVVPIIAGFINGVTDFVTKNPKTVALIASMTAAVIGVGAAMVVAGTGISIASSAIGVLLTVASAAMSPISLIGAAIAIAASDSTSFGDSIRSALSGIGSLAGSAGNAIGGAFSGVVADASIVFGDLLTTAKTTFAGIRDAIAVGDLAGAMDVLWAGLQAGWLRGVEGLMNYVDSWVALFQNTFTYLGTTIAQTWDALWTGVVATFNIFGAVLTGAFDNMINPILAMWDMLESGVRKAWIRISGIFGDAEAKQAALDAVDAEINGRAEKRGKESPGITARVEKATQDNAKEAKASEDRRRAMGENADATAQARLDQNAKNAEARRAATKAAEDRVNGVAQSKAEQRQSRNVGETLINQLDTASSMDELRTISEQIHDLHSRGMITDEQKSRYDSNVDAATERVQLLESGKGSANAVSDAATRGAEDALKSKAEVMGTFSGAGLGGLGFGSSLAERQAKAAEETAAGVKQLVKQGSEGVAA